MDFDSLLAGYKNKTCIMSVELFSDGTYGNIRIAAGNRAHCDDMMNTMHRPFIPDSPYEEYFPQDKNFEDFCYRCAIQGQPLHSYVQLPQMNLWLNMILLPLTSDRENIGYCVYSYDVTPYADSAQRASLSADTSSAVLQTCIKLRGTDDSREVFREVIEDIRQICDADECGILLSDHQTCSCTLLGESLKPGCELHSISTYLDRNAYEFTLSWGDTIGDSTCLILKDSHDMEWLKQVNPDWHASLAAAGAGSIVLFPLNYNGETLGYMWVVNFNIENAVKIKETLELATFFIASEISNFLLMQKLERLSSIDILTGLKNRNCMNNVITDIMTGKIQIASPCPVIFADLNGLKRINDEEGHDAGDRFLKAAAAILREVFAGTDVFRAGGDEFMILASGMPEDELNDRVNNLRTRAEEENLQFAIGIAVANDRNDMHKAMHIADEMMYNDKREYYEKHPERKYR